MSLFLLLLFYQVNFLLLFSVFLLLSMHTHSSLCVSVCQPFKKENPSNSRRRLLGTVAVARNYLQSAMGRECVRARAAFNHDAFVHRIVSCLFPPSPLRETARLPILFSLFGSRHLPCLILYHPPARGK